jgi:mRNA-degrading endonuclease RelE of RelBE toxin-antitoxin system
MSYSIVTIPPFDRQLKHLAKKYPSIKKDIEELGRELREPCYWQGNNTWLL